MDRAIGATLVMATGALLLLLSVTVWLFAGKRLQILGNRDWTKLGRIGMTSGGVVLVTLGVTSLVF